MAYYKYQDSQRQWRWRLRTSNGRIIADSGEGYVSEEDCDRGIELVKGSRSSPVYRE